MGKWLGKSRPWLKIDVDDPTRGLTPGVRFLEDKDVASNKAPDDGVYTLGAGRFRVKKGDAMPDGAKFSKVEGKSAEKREAQSSKRGGRPTETTDAKGPSETADASAKFEDMTRVDLDSLASSVDPDYVSANYPNKQSVIDYLVTLEQATAPSEGDDGEITTKASEGHIDIIPPR